MEITDFTLRVLILGTPGVLACKVLEAMTGVRYSELWRAATDALVYSLVGYALLGTLSALWDESPAILDFLSSAQPVNFNVVGLTSGISIASAGAWTWLRR